MRSATLKNKTNLVINSDIELGEQEGNGKGRYFMSRFIEPGIAHYEELGDILITKETLNKFIQTMVGVPVIIDHEDVTDKNVDKLRVGSVSKVWFNEFDGYFYCEGILTDPEAIDLVKNQGWNVSCAYSFQSVPKDTHNGKKIDLEFIDGEFLHLAIVKNPRYEGANIVVNKDDTNYIAVGKGEKKHIIPLEKIEDKKQREEIEKKSKDLKELKKDFDTILKEKMSEKDEEKENEKKFDKEEALKKAEMERAIFEYKQEKDVKNNIGDTVMQVLNELKEFIKSVVSNEKEDEMAVKNEDKRKLIDEIGGILKDKVDDEIIRTVIKKAEELSYEPSEDDKADNKAKNEDEEDKEEAKNKCKNEEDEKEEEIKEDIVEDEDDEEKEKAENKKVKNSLGDIVMGGNIEAHQSKLYTSRKERLEEGNKY